MVRATGVEPARHQTRGFRPPASTSSATPAQGTAQATVQVTAQVRVEQCTSSGRLSSAQVGARSGGRTHKPLILNQRGMPVPVIRAKDCGRHDKGKAAPTVHQDRWISKPKRLKNSYSTVSVENGAQGGARTHKRLVLNQTGMPMIPVTWAKNGAGRGSRTLTSQRHWSLRPARLPITSCPLITPRRGLLMTIGTDEPQVFFSVICRITIDVIHV